MTNIQQINNFIAIIEHNSFSRAADAMCQSIPSVSRQLSDLENSLGNLLIIRNRRNLLLTEFGKIYYKEVKELIRHHEKLETIVHTYKNEPSGILKIMLPDHSFSRYILPYLAEFRNDYPRIIPDIEISESLPTIHDEKIDVLISMEAVVEQFDENTVNVVKKYLKTNEVILCCSPEYIEKFGCPQSPEEMHQHFYLAHSYSKKPKYIYFNDTHVKLEPYLYINKMSCMIDCARNSVGIIHIIKDYVQADLDSGRLIEILPNTKKLKDTYLYYRKVDYLEPKVAKFVDFIFKKINKQAVR